MHRLPSVRNEDEVNEKGKLNWFKPRTPKEGAQPTEDTAEQPAEDAKPKSHGRRSSKKQVEVAKEQAID